MSRFTKKVGKLDVSYGFDQMTPEGGYFFQVFKPVPSMGGREDKAIVNEGFVKGISKSRMLELMEQYKVGTEEQKQKIALDLPI